LQGFILKTLQVQSHDLKYQKSFELCHIRDFLQVWWDKVERSAIYPNTAFRYDSNKNG